MDNHYERLASGSRRVVLVSYVALLAALTINTMLLPSCNREPNAVIWGLNIVPVLLFLPGIWRQNVRSHVWLTFILLGHFMAAVSTVFACTSAMMLIEVGLLVIVFVSAMLYIRWRSRELKHLVTANAVTT